MMASQRTTDEVYQEAVKLIALMDHIPNDGADYDESERSFSREEFEPLRKAVAKRDQHE